MKAVALPRMLSIAIITIAMGFATMGLWRVDSEVRQRSGEAHLTPPVTAGAAVARNQDARSQALRRLMVRPIDGGAFRLLGEAAEAEHDPVAARRFHRIAVARAPRDAQSRARLLEYALDDGQVDASMEHLDALLRVDPDGGQRHLAGMSARISDAGWREALSALLATEPPWRYLLPAAFSTTPDPESAQALLASLASRGGLRPEEILWRTRLLEQLGRPLQARAVWAAALPAAIRRWNGLIFDGGFEYGAGPEPYGWRLQSPPGIAVGLDTTDPAQGRSSLGLLFDGRAAVFSGVSQDLVLEAGSYRFDLRVHQAVSPDAGSLAWVFTCRTDGNEIGRLSLPAMPSGWQPLTSLLQVPDDCKTQQIALVQEPRSLRERRLSGRLAFDELTLMALTR